MQSPLCTDCDASKTVQYYKDLQKWDQCKRCALQGYGITQEADGAAWQCDPSKVLGNFHAECLCGPVLPCRPFLTPPVNQWEQLEPHAKGTVVVDPQYGPIIYGFWNQKAGRPLLASEAPYLKAAACAATMK